MPKVGFSPNPTIQISGHADKFEDRGSSSISGESRESQSLVSLPPTVTSDHSQRVSQFPRHSESRGRLCPIGQTVCQTSAVLPQVLLTEGSGSSRSDPAHGSILSPHAMVGERVKLISRSSTHSAGPAGNATDRCDAHQLLGDEGDSQSHPKLSGLPEGQVSSGSLRQHDGSVAYKETGQYTFNVPVRPNHSIIRIVHVPGNNTASHIYPRETKCDGGPTVQNVPGTAGRMDVGAKCLSENPSIVSGSPSRLVSN